MRLRETGSGTGLQLLLGAMATGASLTGFGILFDWLRAETEVNPAAEAAPGTDPFYARLSDAALERTRQKVRYDPAYVAIDYPDGDVPADTGVCTDVVIRSYRKLGIDLQQLVHEDMKANFGAYPKNWGLTRPDTNIDHRRVPNLETFFTRQGAAVPVSDDEADYLPGDLVTWDLNGRNLWHIGIVVPAPEGRSRGEAWFVHNIGEGPVLESGVFQWEIVGHYRYRGPEPDKATAAAITPRPE